MKTTKRVSLNEYAAMDENAASIMPTSETLPLDTRARPEENDTAHEGLGPTALGGNATAARIADLLDRLGGFEDSWSRQSG